MASFFSGSKIIIIIEIPFMSLFCRLDILLWALHSFPHAVLYNNPSRKAQSLPFIEKQPVAQNGRVIKAKLSQD